MLVLSENEIEVPKLKKKLDVKVSPIFYMGNKKKLVAKGLTKLFPEDIDTFYELFSGSAVVSINTAANNYVLNDRDKPLYTLYSLFQSKSAEEIIQGVEARIERFGLPVGTQMSEIHKKKTTDRVTWEKYNKRYDALRQSYNKTKDSLDLYTLMFYAFSQQYRFNNTGEFNMPFGNRGFLDSHKEQIRNGCEFFGRGNVTVSELKYFEKWYDLIQEQPEIFKVNDFVYLDPPYNNTSAVYNERQERWTDKHENMLYEFCEKLTELGVSFALSNVFNNKGKENTKLKDWVYKNNYNVYSFAEHTYTACGKGNSKAQEVLITNYLADMKGVLI